LDIIADRGQDIAIGSDLFTTQFLLCCQIPWFVAGAI
jgi:hypothetical protein